MQMCQHHWDLLREAIKKRGMYHLVAKSGAEAAENTVAEIQGTATKRNFDPLMQANWMISSRVISIGGLAMLSHEICPLCEVRKAKEGTDQVWIDGCTDAVLDHCRKEGLLLRSVPKGGNTK